MNLNVEKWGEFSINSLFDVLLSKGDLKIDEVESGLIPLISSGETNNGVVGYIDSRGDGKAKIFKGNAITIDMFGNAFYQKDDFYAVSHGRVNILMPKFNLNQNIAMFIITLIYKNQYRYSYGRALYSDEAKKMIIKLPINAKGEPDWEFMENYIKSLHYKPLTTKNRPENVPPLNVDKWGEFSLKELFNIKRGSRLVKDEDYFDDKDNFYKFPVITAKTTDNGVDGYYYESNCDGNCIIACGEASGMYSTYQKEPCWIMDTARIFSFKENIEIEFTPTLGLFFAALLTYNMYRFSYGRKAKPSNMNTIIIKLPVKKCLKGKTYKFSKNGYVPDFEFMENYIKSLPYGDKI